MGAGRKSAAKCYIKVTHDGHVCDSKSIYATQKMVLRHISEFICRIKVFYDK